MKKLPALVFLHAELNLVKLQELGRIDTDTLKATLLPGRPAGLKCRPDGTLLDGHHRVYILRTRGIDVDALPRDVIEKDRES